MRRNVAGQMTNLNCPQSVHYLSASQISADRYPRFGQIRTDKNLICPPHFSLLLSHFKSNTDRWTDGFQSTHGGNIDDLEEKTSKNKVSRLDSDQSVHLSTRRARRA